MRFSSRSYDSFSLPRLPISKSWGIIILANANVQNKQLGAGNLLTTDKLANVRIASVVGGFHLATQGKVVGYDKGMLARVGMRIGCGRRTASRKIP